MSRSKPDVLWLNPLSQSFSYRFVWKVNFSIVWEGANSFAASRDLGLNKRRSDPSYENRNSYGNVLWFVRNPFEISKICQWAAIRWVGMVFPTTATKLVPKVDPFPKFGVGSKTWKKAKRWIFHVHKTLLWNCSVQQLPSAILIAHMFRIPKFKHLKNRCIFTHSTIVLVLLSIDAYALCFKQLYLRNSCLDLHVI